jgi:hypothetical protein
LVFQCFRSFVDEKLFAVVFILSLILLNDRLICFWSIFNIFVFFFYFRISIKVKDYFWFEAFIVIVQTGTSTLNISFSYFFTMMQTVYHYQWKFNLSRCVSLSVNSWLVRLCIIISEKLTCHAVYHFQWKVNLPPCVSLSVEI